MISQSFGAGMEVRCRLELIYENEDQAEKVLRAVAVDNETFVAAKREGRTIVSEIGGKSILALLNTIEDYLACVSVAEKTIKGLDIPRARTPPRPSRSKASRRGS